jgi:hypothetical protein
MLHCSRFAGAGWLCRTGQGYCCMPDKLPAMHWWFARLISSCTAGTAAVHQGLCDPLPATVGQYTAQSHATPSWRFGRQQWMALLYRSRSASTLYAGWRIQHGCHTAEHLAPQQAPETDNTAQENWHMLSHANTFHHYTARVQGSAAMLGSWLWVQALVHGVPNLGNTCWPGGPHCLSESWAKDHLTVGLPHPLCQERKASLSSERMRRALLVIRSMDSVTVAINSCEPYYRVV